MDTSTNLLNNDWETVLSWLPPDLEQTAYQTGAIRRKRQVRSAEQLLRLLLVYTLGGYSLRNTAAWSQLTQQVSLSDVALLKRFRNAAPWVGKIVTQLLQQRKVQLALPSRKRRIRLMDATVVTQPGSQGTDWRVHLSYDLEAGCIDDVSLTDAKTGETFGNTPWQAGEIAIGDRCYGVRSGIAAVCSQGADVLVRINWSNLPLQVQGADGNWLPFDLVGALEEWTEGEVQAWEVRTAPDASQGLGAFSGRVLAYRKPAGVAEACRREVRKQYKKKGKTPDARTLLTAGFVLVFTTVEAAELPVREGLELYRYRWQIEMVFKRLKSYLDLDALLAQDGALCRTFLLTKLVAALLVEDLVTHYGSFSPWGGDGWASCECGSSDASVIWESVSGGGDSGGFGRVEGVRRSCGGVISGSSSSSCEARGEG